MVFCPHCKLIPYISKLNDTRRDKLFVKLSISLFLISYNFFDTFVHCTIFNALSTGCLVVIGVSMKKEKQRLKLMVFFA